jgi:tetrahydrodipicolinate N-succinyltransferase
VLYQPITMRKTSIGPNCFIGAGAKILAGTTLGRKCVVGANAVVRGDFPDFSVWWAVQRGWPGATTATRGVELTGPIQARASAGRDFDARAFDTAARLAHLRLTGLRSVPQE